MAGARSASRPSAAELDRQSVIAETEARLHLQRRRARAVAPPPDALSKSLHKAFGHILKEHGAGIVAIQRRWPEIAGDKFGKVTLPVRISNGKGGKTLVVAVLPGAAVVVQHKADMLLERIRTSTGTKFDRIRLDQGPLPSIGEAPQRRQPEPVKKIDAEQQRRLADSLAPVENRALKHALMDLGEAVLRRTAK